jgi:hypothetical protein
VDEIIFSTTYLIRVDQASVVPCVMDQELFIPYPISEKVRDPYTVFVFFVQIYF